MHPPIKPSLSQNSDFNSYKNSIISGKFSRDQFILDCSVEKLRRELEEELKMSGEEPQSHAWYHGAIPRQVAENLVQRDGDFLIRDSVSSPGSYVLTCQWRNAAQHFKINKKVLMLNEAYCRVEYRVDREGFDSVPSLIRFYVGNRKPVSQVVGAIIFQPINRSLPLRCLEEKYGLSSNHKEAGLVEQERRSQKRLSLNITNGHTHDSTHTVHNGTHCQDNSLLRSSQLRLKDRCGSQPASLNQVQERRRPLKAHQSESFLPLGSKPQPQQPPDPLLPSPSPKSPVFRTGSEPVLSPSTHRRSAEPQAGQALRGSDSQLCPKPPPKPSKVPLARLPRSPCLQPLMPPSTSSYLTHSSCTSPSLAAPPQTSTCADVSASPRRSGGPPVPPLKPQKFQRHLPSTDSHGCCGSPAEGVQYPSSEAGQWNQKPQSFITEHRPEVHPPVCSYVEKLKREEEGEAEGQRTLDRSSYHHAIAALENTSEEEEEDTGMEEEEEEEDSESDSD
uniref:Breast cancer anti-estrogen resistance 3 n=1 Tax=Iconisemion striatum TaxID=60296 RepID=A0A1A7WH62_9TELE